MSMEQAEMGSRRVPSLSRSDLVAIASEQALGSVVDDEMSTDFSPWRRPRNTSVEKRRENTSGEWGKGCGIGQSLPEGSDGRGRWEYSPLRIAAADGLCSAKTK